MYGTTKGQQQHLQLQKQLATATCWLIFSFVFQQYLWQADNSTASRSKVCSCCCSCHYCCFGGVSAGVAGNMRKREMQILANMLVVYEVWWHVLCFLAYFSFHCRKKIIFNY